MYFDFLYDLFVKCLSFWEEMGEISYMCTGFRVKYPLFLSDLNESWVFSADIRKILKYEISRKSVQWEPSCSMRTDRQTEMTKLIFAFRNFAKAPKNLYFLECMFLFTSPITMWQQFEIGVYSFFLPHPMKLYNYALKIWYRNRP
jgi:hypothetical protein